MLDPLIVLARPMSDPPEPEEWDPDRPLVRQLAGAILTADRALAGGDLEAACAALDHPVVWRACELQSAARLADLHLRIPTRIGSSAERFAKRLALAYFCEVRARLREGQQLDFLIRAWDHSRLDDLTRRARAWLVSDAVREAVASG